MQELNEVLKRARAAVLTRLARNDGYPAEEAVVRAWVDNESDDRVVWEYVVSHPRWKFIRRLRAVRRFVRL
jgi:hypothetical protein